MIKPLISLNKQFFWVHFDSDNIFSDSSKTGKVLISAKVVLESKDLGFSFFVNERYV